jgi:hypothetical protein
MAAMQACAPLSLTTLAYLIISVDKSIINYSNQLLDAGFNIVL